MKFTFVHNNINVLDLEKSVKFYEEALGFKEKRRKAGPGGSFILVFMSDGGSSHELELTWLRDRTEPYSLGDNEFHMALRADDFDAAHKLHSEMGCICYENEAMGIYFINDPDGYWIEILPSNHQ
jgi:lactoylglutathione lyase